MCKFYIETSDLDKAIEAVDSPFVVAAGSAILDLHSEKLKQFALTHTAGASVVSLEQHTKFAIVTGIVLGLKLAESGLSLDTIGGGGVTVDDHDLGDYVAEEYDAETGYSSEFIY